jgi:hypothetical protein
MNIEEIEKFLKKDKSAEEPCIKINFKKRDASLLKAMIIMI